MTYRNRFIFGGVSGANVQANKSKQEYAGGKIDGKTAKRPRRNRKGTTK